MCSRKRELSAVGTLEPPGSSISGRLRRRYPRHRWGGTDNSRSTTAIIRAPSSESPGLLVRIRPIARLQW